MNKKRAKNKVLLKTKNIRASGGKINIDLEDEVEKLSHQAEKKDNEGKIGRKTSDEGKTSDQSKGSNIGGRKHH